MIRERLELVMVEILIIGGWYYGLLLAADCSFCSSYFFDYFTEHKILQCFKIYCKIFFKEFFLHFSYIFLFEKRYNFENLI